MNNEQLVAASQAVLIENYGRLPLAMMRGNGVTIVDADGKEYLDFFPGFGAGGIAGHCHPAITDAVVEQARTLVSHGNLFTNPPQVDLAERITRNAFGGKVFYCHSGAEANEAALKLMRLAAGPGRYKIISFEGCFHGRTMGSLSLTPKSFQAGFEPMLPGNVMVPYGDIEAVRAAIDDETAGVIIEPIQAEGGMNMPTVKFMQELRKLCTDKGLLLCCDEVWTAPARTGKWFAYQHFGIEPDVMTLAKAIGGGMPVGVCVASEKYAAAGAAAMKLIEDESLVEAAVAKGAHATDAIEAAGIPAITEIRSRGLMIGLQLDDSIEAKAVMTACRERGLIVCIAKNNVLRIAPPLTIDLPTLDAGLAILIDVLKDLAA